jgi:dipeptidyl aminopeptidase/acylaminoacyl peptidase
VVSAAGPYELNTLSWGDLWTPIGGDVHAARRLASPIHQITENTKPILIIHSDDDQSVPMQQAVEMADALKAMNVRHEFVHYVDRGHMAITDEVITVTRDFIKAIGGT